MNSSSSSSYRTCTGRKIRTTPRIHHERQDIFPKSVAVGSSGDGCTNSSGSAAAAAAAVVVVVAVNLQGTTRTTRTKRDLTRTGNKGGTSERGGVQGRDGGRCGHLHIPSG